MFCTAMYPTWLHAPIWANLGMVYNWVVIEGDSKILNVSLEKSVQNIWSKYLPCRSSRRGCESVTNTLVDHVELEILAAELVVCRVNSQA